MNGWRAVTARVPHPAFDARFYRTADGLLPYAPEDLIRGGAPVITNLWAAPCECFDQGDCRNRTAEHPHKRCTPKILSRRQLGELALDEIEIVSQPVEVAAGAVRPWRRGGRQE